MSQVVKRQQVQIAILVVALLLGIAIVSSIAIRWLSEPNAKNQYVQDIYRSVSHPQTSQVLFEGSCSSIGGGAASLSCEVTYYCALLTSDSSPLEVAEYYREEFARRAWVGTTEGVFIVDDGSQIEYLEIEPNTPVGMNISIPPETLARAWQSHPTTYLLTVYTMSRDNCS